MSEYDSMKAQKDAILNKEREEREWLEDELMDCMRIVAPGMGSEIPDEINYAMMVTAIRRHMEADTERYEALLERWQKRHHATKERHG